MSVDQFLRIEPSVARELAVKERVCIRPLLRRVMDRTTGTEELVTIACGSTWEAVCPSCAQRARVLRMHQCQEGWHRADEPERQVRTDDGQEGQAGGGDDEGSGDSPVGTRRVRSTRRRQDAPDLPRMPVEERTVGRVFVAPDGRKYRPSMFVTLTLGSYGRVDESGVPLDPDRYDYRRAALDALHFAQLVDRFWQNLRRCAAYRVQYFAAVEPQRRGAPHLHAALRGAIPRAVLRRVVAATYVQLWWPRHDQPVYVDRLPVWDGVNYVDPTTRRALPSWEQALDSLDADPAARPAHVLRFGSQIDAQGILGGTPDADRAVRYLTKYLAKSISGAHDLDEEGSRYAEHLDRLHAHARWLPCSERCGNWLRYGVQPAYAGPGLAPGRCPAKAHDRDHLGLGGRRVLVSRQWSGKALTEHRADRATVVREALLAFGMTDPELDRLAATVTLPDGSPRYVWTDTKPDPVSYTRILLASIAERQRWRAQYETAKAVAVDSLSATGQPP